MVGQLRTYTINKGMMESWLKLFHEVIAPKTLEFGMGIQSAWTDEESERFIWIRTYEDMQDLKKKEEEFYGSDWWKENMPTIRGHLARRQIEVIKPSA